MADWPTDDEIRKLLNLNSDPENWETMVADINAAAIQGVKDDVGDWDDLVDEPDAALAHAARILALLIAERPEAQSEGIRLADPTYSRLLKGHRRRFAIS